MGEIRLIVIIFHREDKFISGLFHLHCLIRNSESELCLATMDIQGVEAGPVFLILRLFLISLLTVRNKEDSLGIHPNEGALFLSACQSGSFLCLHIIEP